MASFCFIDEVPEAKQCQSLTAFFQLKGNEEFLRDHFDGFPVMPGVLLLETAKQASAKLLNQSSRTAKNWRLAGTDDIKFGQFVRPKMWLKVTVTEKGCQNGITHVDARIDALDSEKKAVIGRALLASLRLVSV